MDGRVRIERIARVLEQLDADIIALQEVVNHEGRSIEDHQAIYLATRFGYHFAIGETRKHRGGVYGNVTLSRWLVDEDLLRAIDISGPRIVLGDFNEWTHRLVTQTLSAEFQLIDLKAHVPRLRGCPGNSSATPARSSIL
jgi:endonuclease/exonuclease/phosphatase family metal-dependent hydrolase